MQRLDGLENGNYYIGRCFLTNDEKKIARENPHCAECYNFLKKKKITLTNNNLFHNKLKLNNENDNYCKKHCTNGYLYNYVATPRTEKKDIFKIDQYTTAIITVGRGGGGAFPPQ